MDEHGQKAKCVWTHTEVSSSTPSMYVPVLNKFLESKDTGPMPLEDNCVIHFQLF